MSNARLDFPEPESPVTTISRSRGSSIETFLQVVDARALHRDRRSRRLRLTTHRDLLGFRALGVKERQLLHIAHCCVLVSRTGIDALPRIPRSARYSQTPRDSLHSEIALEVILDLGRPSEPRQPPASARSPARKSSAARFARYPSIAVSAACTLFGVFFALSMSVYTVLKNAGFSSIACGSASRSNSRRASSTSILASEFAAYRIHSAV